MASVSASYPPLRRCYSIRKSSSPAASASPPSTPPGLPVRDPYYGHEETAKTCARFVSHTFSCPEILPPPSPFKSSTSSSTPNVPSTLAHFIAYALHRTRLAPTVTFTALALLQRLKARFPNARGSSGHRLFLSAFMIASKVVCDDTYSNKSWTVVGQGMFSLREVNQMEREMCSYLEWQLSFERSEIGAFEKEVRRAFGGGTGCVCGAKIPFNRHRNCNRQYDWESTVDYCLDNYSTRSSKPHYNPSCHRADDESYRIGDPGTSSNYPPHHRCVHVNRESFDDSWKTNSPYHSADLERAVSCHLNDSWPSCQPPNFRDNNDTYSLCAKCRSEAGNYPRKVVVGAVLLSGGLWLSHKVVTTFARIPPSSSPIHALYRRDVDSDPSSSSDSSSSPASFTTTNAQDTIVLFTLALLPISLLLLTITLLYSCYQCSRGRKFTHEIGYSLPPPPAVQTVQRA